MLSKEITFENFEGETVTEKFWFNLTKLEIVEMEISENGGLGEHLQKLVQEHAGRGALAGIRMFVGASIGERIELPEGRQKFQKTPEFRDEFMASEAFSNLGMELLENPDQFLEFVYAVAPKDLVEAMKPMMDGTAPKEHTDEELFLMPEDEFKALAGPKSQRSERFRTIALRRRTAAKIAQSQAAV